MNQKIKDPNWLAGFSSGEGCFQVRIKNSTKSKLGVQVSLLFKLTQHVRDKELMKSFMDYLNCGYISKNSNWIDYTVVSYNDQILKIIPFFDKYQIVGVKLTLAPRGASGTPRGRFFRLQKSSRNNEN